MKYVVCIECGEVFCIDTKSNEEVEECPKCGCEIELDDYRKCEQCGNMIHQDYMGESELALQDSICKECMEEGYGK